MEIRWRVDGTPYINFLMKNKRFIIYPYLKHRVNLPIKMIRIVEIFVNYKFYRKHFNHIDAIKKALKLRRDFTTMFYALIFLALASIEFHSEKCITERVTLEMAKKLIVEIWSIEENNDNIENFIKSFASLFRKWEAFVFEL